MIKLRIYALSCESKKRKEKEKNNNKRIRGIRE